MAEPFVELGATGLDKLTDKYFDTVYDAATKKKPNERITEIKEQVKPRLSAVSGNTGESRKHRNRLPSPEGDVGPRGKDFYSDRRSHRRHSSLERESLTSAQVLDDYESERTDPTRKPESVLSKRDLNKIRRDSKVGGSSSRMSYANGYAADRPRSQQPPRSRYAYDDDDSDYDERTGKRYGASGRGYDDRYDDRDYDREIIETERYRGPARPYDAQRNDSYRTSRTYDQSAGAGAVTHYNRRSAGEVADYESRRSGRSRSRGRRDRDRSYSDSRSRSRSRSRSKSGIRGKIDETFDTSTRGLGVGLAGAIAGGLAGRQFGNKKNHERDIIIGAIVGGLGANAAENKWRDWKDGKEKKLERDEERWEQKWDGRDYGRSRSAMR